MYTQLESLENRTFLSVYPIPQGTIQDSPALWSVDSHGGDLKRLIPNISVPSGGSPYQAVVFQGSLYVLQGSKLWKTDGTVPGTKLVAGQGTQASMVTWLGVVGDTLYYTEIHYDQDAHEDYGYLRSTGGTVPIQYGAIYPAILGGKLYVDVERYLPLRHTYWAVDGTHATQIDTPVGSSPRQNDPTGDSATVDGANIYAHADGVHGNEIWVDDGDGARLAQDIFRGDRGSLPNNFHAVGHRVVFYASSPAITDNSAAISGGILMIRGSSGDDEIDITTDGQQTTVTLTNPAWPNVLQSTFDDEDFDQISVNGGAGNDRIDLSGAAHPATLCGDDGNDTITPGSGNDSIDGGAGNDTLDYSALSTPLSSKDSISIDAGSNGIDTYLDIETLLCGSGDDHISIAIISTASPQSSVRYIDGGAGNDALYFFYASSLDTTAPTVHGGDGDDTLSVDREGGSTITGAGPTFYFGDAGNDTFKMHRSLASRDFNGGDGIDSVDYRMFNSEGGKGLKITLDDQPGDGGAGLDNVHSDVEIVYGTDWNDTIIGNSHNETLVGDYGDDVLIGGGGNDSLVGQSGDDTLNGGDGNDTIDGGDGNDSLDGGAGENVLDYSRTTQRLTANIVYAGLNTNPNHISSGPFTDSFANFETLLSGSGDDDIRVLRDHSSSPVPYIHYIDGGAGNDFLFIQNEFAGNTVDYLHGGDGDDTLRLVKAGVLDHRGGAVYAYGEAGNDTFIMTPSAGEHLLFGGDGIDTVDYSRDDAVNVSLDDNQNDGPKGWDNVHSDVEVVFGTSHDDEINGDGQNETLYGNGGDDTITGNAGDGFHQAAIPPLPVVTTQSVTPPVVVLSDPVPTYVLTNGLLVVTGTDAAENIVLRRRPTNKKILEVVFDGIVKRTFTATKVTSIQVDAGAGNDQIHLETLAIAGKLNGGLGGDLIYGSAVADRINGGAGDDVVYAGAGNDSVYGDSGRDKLFGEAGKDYLVGGAGKDAIRGGADLDRIIATIGLDDIRENTGDIITNVVA